MPVWDKFIQAQALYARNEHGPAMALYRQVLDEQPDHAPSLHMLGMILYQHQQFPMAVELIARSVAVDPNAAQARSALAMALEAIGRTDEALTHYEASLRLDASAAWTHAAYALSLHRAKRHIAAEAAARRALELMPSLSMAHNALGLTLQGQERFPEAAAAFEAAAAIDPNNPLVLNNLGIAYAFAENHDAAVQAFERTVQLAPNFVEAFGQLALNYRALGRIADSAKTLERMLAVKPDSPEGHMNLGDCRSDQYRMPEAWQHYATAVNLVGAPPVAAMTYLCSLLYQPDLPPTFVDHEHRRMAQVFAPPFPTPAEAFDADPDRPLRVGYVSPDLREHAVARFLVGLFENHDRSQFSVFAYSNAACEDAMSRRLESHCDGWRNIAKLSDDAAAEVIENDTLDLLVDLAGYTSGGRPALLARRLAPAQFSFLGYAHSTALAAADYRLTDAIADPPAADESAGQEKFVRIDGCAWQYTPDPRMPAVSPPPCLSGPRVTFGSLNNFAKLSEKTIAAWAAVLHAVPGSQLLLKTSQGAGDAAGPELRRAFAGHGVDEIRIDVRPYAKSFADHLKTFAEIDVALDPFPYNGTTTTCDALWMGIPIVAMRGHTHAARVSESLLTAMGLTPWIADTQDDYVALAAGLARDRVALTTWRQRLRPMMAASPLGDAAGYARRVEAALRSAWRDSCRRASGSLSHVHTGED